MSADSAAIPPIDPATVGAHDTITPMLGFIRAASGGRLLNMHLQMAASPLVLEQHTALRRAIGGHATLGPLPRAAVAVAASAADASWTAQDLTEAYGYLALVSYCDRFVRYAGTEFDRAFAATAR